MEDASLALRIAEGVMIGVLLITLLLFVFSRISVVENSEADKQVIENTEEFNKKYNAYDKPMMYGTDVISVLGMAINNNKVCNQKISANPDGIYHADDANSININFKVKKSAIQTKKTEYVFFSGYDSTQGKNVSEWRVDTTKSPNPEYVEVFKVNTMYSLSNNPVGSYQKIVDIAINGNSNITKQITSRRIIETDSSGFNDFKLRIFECTNVQYNNVGRVCSMTFEEIN